MKIYKVPCWLRNGSQFRELSSELSSKLPDEFINFIETSEINSMEDFSIVYRLSSFWGLDRKPLDIYVYAFLNQQEVIKFLKELETHESEEDIEDILDPLTSISYLLL